MNSFVFPQIISAGIFDSDVVFGDIPISKKRLLKRFELEFHIQDGGISYINDTECPNKTNTIICAKPGQYRYSHLPLRCYYIHILAEEGTICDYLSSLPDYITPENPEKFRKIFTDISLAHSFAPQNSDLYIAGKLLHLIYLLLYEETATQTENNAHSPLLLQALSFMDAHFLENLSLDTIANVLNLHPIYFHRIFSEATGKTPHQYLLDKRLQEAQKLLCYSELTLTEIAIKTGFSSQSHFGAVFKKATGKTPLQFKKEMFMNYLE